MTEKPKNVRTKTADCSPDIKFNHYWSLRIKLTQLDENIFKHIINISSMRKYK